MVPAKAPWQTVSVLTDLLEGKHQETWVRFRSGVPEKAVEISPLSVVRGTGRSKAGLFL
ncbi:hypothetical protein SDJN02_19489, partial [Cucurbita argyrosperma subsp. argyrosperma]